ncbi:MAG: hypothetical protein JWO67_4630 [Streptosporangiaceae bacterium]|jgi:hypothetical protein|nr:hypothetical protein [Streptosporangiaceae bacterium]
MLRLTNGYNSIVWAMIEWYHPNCPDGGDWEKEGWWQLQPGESKIAYAGDLNDVGFWWYGFAHAADGRVWGGNFPELVPARAFRWCEHTADTSSRTVGMFEFPGGQSDKHVVTFR